ASTPNFINITATGTNCYNGIQLDGGTITGAGHWKNFGLPYVATSDVSVGNGASLLVDSGTIVKFLSGCALNVDGTLTALGTSNSPIYFTSIHDDVGGDTNGNGSGTTPAAGNWERLKFSPTSSASSLDYCVIRYGGVIGCCTNYAPMVDITDASPTFNHSTFSN